MKRYLTRLTATALLSFPTLLMGQTQDSLPNNHLIHQMEFDIAPCTVFQTKDFLKGENQKGEKIDKSIAVHLKYGFQFAPESYFGRLYPHTYQGIGLSYNTFYNSEEVGNPVAVYFYQGSRLARLSQKLSLDYEWNFGASFGWKPHNNFTNAYNNVIGSNVNAYINLGLFLNWQMSHLWKITTGIAATHYSNGNTRYPNAGLNLIGTRIGITRVFDAAGTGSATGNGTLPRPSVKPHISDDLVIFGTWRSKGIVEKNYAVPGSFGVVGFNFNPMYNINRLFNAGISLDGEFDESANIQNHIAGNDDNGNIAF